MYNLLHKSTSLAMLDDACKVALGGKEYHDDQRFVHMSGLTRKEVKSVMDRMKQGMQKKTWEDMPRILFGEVEAYMEKLKTKRKQCKQMFGDKLEKIQEILHEKARQEGLSPEEIAELEQKHQAELEEQEEKNKQELAEMQEKFERQKKENEEKFERQKKEDEEKQQQARDALKRQLEEEKKQKKLAGELSDAVQDKLHSKYQKMLEEEDEKFKEHQKLLEKIHLKE